MGAESSTGTSTDTNATTTVDNAAETTQDSSGAKETPNQEAARHRIRAKEAEAERDALAGVVAGLRTSIVNGLAENAGIKPDLLWASGVTVDALLSDAEEGEDGAGLIDTTKVDAAIIATRDKFDLPAPGYNPGLGRDGPDVGGDAFEEAFKPPGGQP